MTLTEMKKQVLALIEEINEDSKLLTDDPDISNKIDYVINQIQNELSRIKKIPARKSIEVTEGQMEDLPKMIDDFYQLNIIRGVKNNLYNDTVEFQEDGTAEVFYFKYPTQITSETIADEYKFELSTDALQIMPYGVAGDLLKSDISANYGQVYSNRYTELKQQLDPRYHTGSIYIEGGTDTDEFI